MVLLQGVYELTYVLSPGFSGDTRFLRSLYVFAPIIVSKTVLLLACVMLFAVRKWPSHSAYCVQSSWLGSNSPMLPIGVAMIRTVSPLLVHTQVPAPLSPLIVFQQEPHTERATINASWAGKGTDNKCLQLKIIVTASYMIQQGATQCNQHV